MQKLRPTRLSLFLGLVLLGAVALTIYVATSDDDGPGEEPRAESTFPDEPPPTPVTAQGVTPTPAITPSPVPTAPATALPPSATATPRSPPQVTAPTATPDVFEVDCSTPLQSVIDHLPDGGSINLTGCSYNTSVRLNKPVTVVGVTIELPQTSPWTPSAIITADNVTLDGWHITGGGTGVSVLGRSNIRIANSTFEDSSGSAVALWGEGRGANNVVIEGNTITQTRTSKVSPIVGRGSENCSVYSRNLTIRGNSINQGEGDVGWFGIELKCHDGVVIESNSLRGGHVLVSLPSTNNVTITGNSFDMRGRVYWGVEVPKANNVTVERNSFLGDGPGGNDHAVSMNSGSVNTRVYANTLSEMRTVIDLGGEQISVRDNCLSNVSRVTEYDSSGKHLDISGNGAC